MIDPYKKYGLRRVVNAAACLTRLGGSKPSERVLKAMEEASGAFIDIPSLQTYAGGIIAEATGAEAGLPTSGAVNSIVLAAAACIMRGTELENYEPLYPERWRKLAQRLPLHTDGLRTEFIVQKVNRYSYDFAVECAGGRMVEVGSKEGTTILDLESAYNSERTAAYYFTVHGSQKGIPLEKMVEVAHRNGVPVIVDAAPDLRPKNIFRYYIDKGADLVLFSGGKHLGGPNNSGILAGRGDLIKLAHLQAYPFNGIGRQAKMSRETIIGLVEAIKQYLERDDEAMFKLYQDRARKIAEHVGLLPGVESGLAYEYTSSTGELMTPFTYVKLSETAGMTLRELHGKLLENDPPIETLYPAFLIQNPLKYLTINPEYLLDGDDKIVVDRMREIFETR